MQQVSSKNRRKSSKLPFIMFFIILVCDSSFYMQKQTSGTVRLLIDAIALCVLLLFFRPKMPRVSFCMMLISLVLPLGWVTISGDVKQTIIICAATFVGWVVSISLSKETILSFYGKAMSFLSVFSLVALLVYTFFPAIIRSFPIADQTSYLVSYNLFFSVVTQTGGILRNYGIFWEPGAFAVFLCIALWSELFFQKTNIKRVVLYVLTIISTFSTLGILCSFVLVIAYLLHNKSINKTVRNLVILMFFVAILWVAFFGERFIYEVFGKIASMNDSATTRWNSFYYVGELFLSAPFLGVGISDFLAFSDVNLSGMATFTFMNCLAMHGIFGLIPIVGVIRFFTKIETSYLSKAVLLLFVGMLFATQAFEQVSFFYTLAFSGFMTMASPKRAEV